MIPPPQVADPDVEQLVNDVLRRRASGDEIADEAVIAEYRDVASELRDRLRVLRMIERARVLASLPRHSGELDSRSSPLPQLAGYVMLSELARGGQSRLFVACRQSDGQLVAIKIIDSQRFDGDLEQNRLKRELDALRSVEHSGVVKVVDHGTTDSGEEFIATRFVEGDSLRPDKIAQNASVPERLILFRQICDAVAAAHKKGIVHRDLKPSNIRIDRTGRPHVLDFGLASRIDPDSLRQSLTVTGEFVGTFLWASPEQKSLGDQPITPASDVYSLGVILHQLLTGGQFPPQTYESLESVVADRTPRDNHRYPAIADRRLRRILSSCLATDSTRRFQDAKVLAEAVANVSPRRPHRWLIGGTITAASFLTAYGVHWHIQPATPGDVIAWEKTPSGSPVLHLPNLPPLAFIPPGEFRMGSDDDEDGYPDERPSRPVTIERGFFMGIYEVSQAQYQAVMGINPSRFVGASALPVERVSYHDAMEFCRRVSEQTGRVVRLPTEAEWEYAARSGSTAPFQFGGDERMALRFANFADLSNTNPAIPGRMNYNDGFPQTAEVGRFVSNAFFLYDMHGNVWEWCQGPYLIDPTDPTTAREDLASARGGSWWDMPGAGRSANRNPLKLDAKVSTLGFRVVVEEKSRALP